MIFWFCFCIIFIPISILFPTKVVNKKNFPKGKKNNVIVCCNHMSNLDAPLLDLRLKKKIFYLCKKELFKNKFSGFFMKKFGCISIDRSKADLGAIKKTFKALNDGKTLGVFPQGTREQEGDIDADTVKNGVSMFSLRTGTPVLPMVILKKPKMFRKNYIIVGEPLAPDMSRSKDKEYAEEFTKIIVDKMNELLHNGRERFINRAEKVCKKK